MLPRGNPGRLSPWRPGTRKEEQKLRLTEHLHVQCPGGCRCRTRGARGGPHFTDKKTEAAQGHQIPETRLAAGTRGLPAGTGPLWLLPHTGRTGGRPSRPKQTRATGALARVGEGEDTPVARARSPRRPENASLTSVGTSPALGPHTPRAAGGRGHWGHAQGILQVASQERREVAGPALPVNSRVPGKGTGLLLWQMASGFDP